jgi:hypothetical protein
MLVCDERLFAIALTLVVVNVGLRFSFGWKIEIMEAKIGV